MKYANTYKHKLNTITKQIKLYDGFLQVTSLPFEERIKLMQEITRLERIKQHIESLPIRLLNSECKDFNIKANSSINESGTKTKLRYTFGSKPNCKQGI